jgi:hypothetical protein
MENKTEKLDIDLEEFTKNELIRFIMYAHARNITFNEAICDCLKCFIELKETTNNND